MDTIPLMNQEQLLTGCSHARRLPLADILALALAAGATTALTIDISDYVARDVVDKAMFDLVTPFDGGATSELTVKFGYNGVAVDDDDAFIAATSVHADSTEILASVGTGTRFAAQEAGKLQLILTSTGANISALTAGEIILYFNQIRLPQLRGING